MAALAKHPYSFDDFDAVGPAEPVSDTEEISEIDRACAAAREDERARLHESETAKQNALLKQLLASLQDQKSDYNAALEAFKGRLLDAVSDVQENLSELILHSFDTGAARLIIDQYLQSGMKDHAAVLRLSEEFDAVTIGKIEQIIADAQAESFITIECVSDTGAAPVQLTWNRGAIQFDKTNAAAVADKLFQKAIRQPTNPGNKGKRS